MVADPAFAARTLTCVYRAPVRRGLLAACLLPWLMPTASARRTQSLPLLAAFAIHLLAAASGFLLIVLLSVWEGRSDLSLHEVGERFVRALQDILRVSQAGPGGVSAVLGISAAVILGLHFLLAVVLMPWGARDEPLRHSLRNSLRQTWLHTTHCIPAILLIGLGAIGLDRLNYLWHATHPGPKPPIWPQGPAAPQLPQSDPGYAQALKDFQKAHQEWQRQVAPISQQWSRVHNAWWNSRPWFLRHDELAVGIIVFAVVLWMFGSLLRGIGAPREVAAIARPPTCLGCGYNLTTMPLDGRCSECGRIVGQSVGPGAQPGMPWEHRRTLGRFRAWQATGVLTTRSAAEAGRTLRVSQNPVHHRRFLYMHLPGAVLVGACGYLGLECLSYQNLDLFDRPDEFVIYPLSVGVICGVVIAGLTCLAATIIGLWQSWRCRRNLLPAAMSLACYLIPVLLALEIIAAVLVVSAELLDRKGFFRSIPHVPVEVAMTLFVGLPCLFFISLYWRLLLRGTKAARYANV